ncbi:hypothetical protein L1987_79939 [Smallanthus sonchifolius]|uniref:Uncharacterized protein n=1 Tax=Smallanthus sonchifolius TaxID=185202 RepID=A0ACB8YMH6_9ASTR|nr:hypothetical protein L1987_79939 [Smallanthus sonchifolius]
MAQGTETIFSNEELSAFVGQNRVRAPHYIEVACGCTNRLGDSMGIMRISDDGTIHATCHCNQGCNRVFNCPAKFAKHALSGTSMPNWRKKVWVLNSMGEKIKLGETCLVRFYKGDEYVRPRNLVSHRDEFLSCSVCNKVRHFELRSKDECRLYHDAAARETRTCSDMIPGRWTCEDLEARRSRSHSGCRKNSKCKGCKHCVCFGCEMCRFEDCGCQMCTDFYANAPN